MVPTKQFDLLYEKSNSARSFFVLHAISLYKGYFLVEKKIYSHIEEATFKFFIFERSVTSICYSYHTLELWIHIFTQRRKAILRHLRKSQKTLLTKRRKPQSLKKMEETDKKLSLSKISYLNLARMKSILRNKNFEKDKFQRKSSVEKFTKR